MNTNQTLRDILDKMIWDIALDDGIGDGEKQVDQALKEISELLVECKPEKDVTDIFDTQADKDYVVGYNQAIDDYEKNIKARLQ